MADYYVDIDAPNDLGAGTIGDPFKYINTHVGILVAGDTMHVRGNVGVPKVHTETARINITVSGAVGNVITINPYQAEEVELRGPAGVHLFRIAGDYITIEGFEINKQDNGDAAIQVDGGDYISILNCEIYDTDYWTTIQVANSTGTLIDGCTIHDAYTGDHVDAHGIAANHDIDDLTITNCTIYDNTGDCIQILDSGTVGDVLIEDCVLYTTLAECSENAVDSFAGNIIIRRVEAYGFYHCDSTCGGTGGGAAAFFCHETSTVLIDDCEIYDCTVGVRARQGITITVQKTRIYDLHTQAQDPPSTYWGAFVIESSGTTAYLYNNTVDDAPERSLYLLTSCTVTIRNNIFNDCGIITQSGVPILTYDHNCWFNCTNTLVGAGDVTADPLFVNEAANDFHLQAGSPCRDAGVNVGLPYQGSAPDMGAFEFQVGSEPVMIHIVVVNVAMRTATATRVGICN